MRVLWVLKEFGLGGAERLLLEIAPYAPQVEFVPVSVTAGPLDLAPALRSAGMPVRILGAPSHLDVRWVGRLRSLARREQPDVVHLHLPYTGAGGRIAFLGMDCRVVYTEHNVWGVYRPVTRWANAVTFGMNDAVIAVSRAVRDSITASPLGRRAGGRLRVVPNGIDTARVRSDAEAEPEPEVPGGAFGTVTTLTHRKGVDVLMAAAARLRTEFPAAACLIAGGGELAGELQERARAAGPSSVRLLGPRPDARSILARLDVVVIASRSEGLPLMLLEAMALGRPVVATRVGGIPEVVEDGVNGLLVPPEDPAALANGIARLLGDAGLAARLGGAARTTVEERWHARRTAALLVETYRAVTGDRRW